MAEQSEADKKIIREAQKRFDACRTWESSARNYFREDYRFANGDARNMYQWDKERRTERDATQRPYLTVNKVRQHCLQIINDGKQNKPSIVVKPTSGEASYESAQVMQDLIRHIEYRSNATLAYDNASSFQVQAGWGYWRVVSDYINDDSFDQELLIKSIHNPLSIYIDPYARETDKSDMRFAFVFEDINRDEMKIRYPEYDDHFPQTTLGNLDSGWTGKDTVRIAEYYRVREVKDSLVYNTETQATMYRSDIPGPIWAAGNGMANDPRIRVRPTIKKTVEWFFIIGDEIKERNIWPGRYIPIVKVIGEEFIIDNVFDCRGHTRALLDPQKMYNFMSSSAVEFGALQTKTPWLVAIESIDAYEQIWKDANVKNYAYLPYKTGIDKDGQPLPSPQRIEPPVSTPMALQGMQVAAAEMQMVSGQFDANMGEKGNERSGIAIDKRQRKGDNATYHYIDNLANAIRYTGKILLDAIPQVYDTERVIQIVGEDGDETRPLTINPQQENALEQQENFEGQTVAQSLNPRVGMYEVQSQVGPLYATRRQEAFDAFTLIMTQAPQLTSIVGDIMMKSADFPLANEAARRLKRMVPKQALGEGPSPEEAQMQEQLSQITQLNRDLIDKIAIMDSQLVRNAAKTAVDKENAATNRLKVMLDANMDAQKFQLEAARILNDSNFADTDHEIERERVEIERLKAQKGPANAGK